MAGINRALSLNESISRLRMQTNIKCVFLSYQKKDVEYCRIVSNYLLNANIDVYFDENDNDLKNYRQSNNPAGVVGSIKKGINNSSHMLCLISPNTIESKWVPWEIGYGYDKTTLGVLTLRGISDSDLPDYLKTTKIIRGTKSLNSFIEELTGFSGYILESAKLILPHTNASHPLDNVLNYQL